MKRLAALIVAISTSITTCSAACITMKEAARIIKSYVERNAMSSELGRCASPNTTPEERKENIREMIRSLAPETELKQVSQSDKTLRVVIIFIYLKRTLIHSIIVFRYRLLPPAPYSRQVGALLLAASAASEAGG